MVLGSEFWVLSFEFAGAGRVSVVDGPLSSVPLLRVKMGPSIGGSIDYGLPLKSFFLHEVAKTAKIRRRRSEPGGQADNY